MERAPTDCAVCLMMHETRGEWAPSGRTNHHGPFHHACFNLLSLMLLCCWLPWCCWCWPLRGRRTLAAFLFDTLTLKHNTQSFLLKTRRDILKTCSGPYPRRRGDGEKQVESVCVSHNFPPKKRHQTTDNTDNSTKRKYCTHTHSFFLRHSPRARTCHWIPAFLTTSSLTACYSLLNRLSPTRLWRLAVSVSVSAAAASSRWHGPVATCRASAPLLPILRVQGIL